MSLLDNIFKEFEEQSLTLQLSTVPVVFLSFDEPNCRAHFEELIKHHPNPALVKNVHGVKGFDAAHKAAAEAAGTTRFFTVDADCLVNPEIWNKKVIFDKDNQHATYSWSSRNAVNGLIYGNGGIKLWYAPYVKNMKTHEAADAEDARDNVDFCWDFENYKQMNETYGTVYANGSAKQAFRAGFREGIKMGLDQGNLVDLTKITYKMYPSNFSRWLIWMTVGADIENGDWTIYGARLAAYMLYAKQFDHTVIKDYEWFDTFWQKTYDDTNHGEYLIDKNNELCSLLNTELKLPVVNLDAAQSLWFKHVFINPPKGMNWGNVLEHSPLPLYGFREPRWGKE